MKKIMILIILALPFLLLSYSWQVNHDGNGDFTDIQSAIDNVSLAAGDSIIVWSDIDSIEYYYESITIERDISFFLCSRQDSSGVYLTENTYICGDSESVDILKIERDLVDTAQIMIMGLTISHLDDINGRGIFITGGDSLTTSSITIDKCNIIDNECISAGGGIYIHTPSYVNQPQGKVRLSDCNISRNIALYGGGILFENTSDKLIVDNCIIMENTLSNNDNYGGAGIYIKNGVASLANRITLDECMIESNTGARYGGGIFIQNYIGYIYLSNCILRENEAISGGGIKIIKGGTSNIDDILIADCEIINNSACDYNIHAAQNGGGLNIVESNFTIERTKIDSNFARTDGGGINIYSKFESLGCKVKIIDSELTNNEANGYLLVDPAGGGIKSVRSNQLLFNNLRIANNIHHCGKGGGLATFGSGANSIQYIEIKECEIDGNQAAGSGGGIYIKEISKLKLTDSELLNNNCNSSGCALDLYTIRDSVYIADCTLKDNGLFVNSLFSNQAGGGIRLYNCGSYVISNSEITGNSSYEGSGIYAYSSDIQRGEFRNLLIAANNQRANPDTVGILGTIALERGQNADFINCTICDNECDTLIVNSGGISLGSEYQNIDLKECILWNNSGDEYDSRISQNHITYCDIEDISFTGNNCFAADPVFEDTISYALHWLSPCIDAGDDSETDPDGSIPDIGYQYHAQDVYNWNYNGNKINWEWRCFPRMVVTDSLNTGQFISPDSVLTSWNPKPDSIHVQYNANTNWLSGIWDIENEWQWDPGNDNEINSTMGMKIYRDQRGTELFYRGALCENETEMSISGSSSNWIGYFLKESQQVAAAIPDAVMDSLLMIQTYRWSMSRNSTDEHWVGTSSYTLNYGDLVILKSVCDTAFCWNEPFRGSEPVYREFATHYQYEEKADYFPVYAALNPDNLPAEIAVYVNGECKGAEKVDADTTQICAYIMEEELGQNIEFELWYGNRQQAERYQQYLLYDTQTGKEQITNLYTGMPGDYYLVSFRDTDNIPPADIDFCCYPNPFNPELKISFAILKEVFLEVNVYNIKGQRVTTLTRENYNAGEYEIAWDGRNSRGIYTGSGIYLIRLKTDDMNFFKKVVMLK